MIKVGDIVLSPKYPIIVNGIESDTIASQSKFKVTAVDEYGKISGVEIESVEIVAK